MDGRKDRGIDKHTNTTKTFGGGGNVSYNIMPHPVIIMLYHNHHFLTFKIIYPSNIF